MAEAYSIWLRPVDHRPDYRRGLRHQRQPAGGRRDVGPRGVQAEPRGRQAEGMAAQGADAGACRVGAQIVGRAGNDGGETALPRHQGHQVADLIRRDRQHREVDAKAKLRGIPNRANLALEAADGEIGQDLGARLRMQADDGDGGGLEEAGQIEAPGRFEKWSRHGAAPHLG